MLTEAQPIAVVEFLVAHTPGGKLGNTKIELAYFAHFLSFPLRPRGATWRLLKCKLLNFRAIFPR